ncbi:MAG: putative protein N(5)-glutamine methyltransferase [Nocardioidaceae bacterium]|nr:putative protein N(5)-glutamine methyltransferase [Nocardioidaceae bacterium]
MSQSSAEADVVLQLRAAGCVFAEDEARILISEATSPGALVEMVERRVAGVPLEHIVGWAEFFGMRVAVDPRVFVPRQRTAFLVEQALALAPSLGAVVIDMCCGCGAIGAALIAHLDSAGVHATDVDPAAVANARRNLGAGGHVYVGDLFEPLPPALRGSVDLIVANAPYVPTDAIDLMPSEARLHEARVALDGGADGLDIQRRIAAEAPGWLAPGGHLLIETSDQQAAHTAAAFEEHGLITQTARSDERDATVVVGRRP